MKKASPLRRARLIPFAKGIFVSSHHSARTRILLSILGLVLNFAAHAQSLNLETNNLVVKSFPLNPYARVLDGQWLGISVASDGNCYFGSSTHDNRHGAAFFRYNPSSNTVTLIAEDLTQICGENPTNTPPQGKLHSDIVEHNGWLYFSTHFGNYWPEGESNYTGGHVLGYQLSTGAFRDFGVVRSNYTCYSAVGVDKVRNKLLVYVTRWWGTNPNSHIYRFDIATGAKQDLGVVGGFSSFWCFTDSRGDCWFSCSDDNGSLRVVRSATGQIQTYNNVLPETQLGSGRWWDWAMALPGQNRCAFKLQFGNYLYIFDADALQNGQNAFTTVRNIGPAESGLAMGNNRVFFQQRANRQPGNQEFMDFHLMSVPLSGNAPIIDHGLIMDHDGRLDWRLPGMAMDSHGRFYMVGDWWLLPGEQGTSIGTLRHVDDPGTNYTAVPRGEFFGVFDTSTSPSLIEPHVLQLSSAGGGITSNDANTNYFLGNAVVNLSATSSNGWRFFGWAGDASGTNNPNSIVMTRSKSIQAVFGTTLNTSTGGGSILLDPPGGNYPYGTMVRATAVPQAGRYFVQWGNSSSANPLLYFVTNGNATLSATFNTLPAGKVTLTTPVIGRGTVSVAPRTNLYNVNQMVSLQAIPNSGQTFSNWSGDASSTANPLAVTLNQSKTITANFSSRPNFEIGFLSSSPTNEPQLNFSGDFGARYRIDATTNLVDWQALGILTNSFGIVQFTDPAATHLDYRFYRALLLP